MNYDFKIHSKYILILQGKKINIYANVIRKDLNYTEFEKCLGRETNLSLYAIMSWQFKMIKVKPRHIRLHCTIYLHFHYLQRFCLILWGGYVVHVYSNLLA